MAKWQDGKINIHTGNWRRLAPWRLGGEKKAGSATLFRPSPVTRHASVRPSACNPAPTARKISPAGEGQGGGGENLIFSLTLVARTMDGET